MKIKLIVAWGLILLLCSGVVFSQKGSKEYNEEWKSVEEYLKKGLPKSALEVVEKVKLDAKITNNSPQFLKANLYKIKLISLFEENYLIKSIEAAEKELETTKGAEKAILHTIIAELYWNYYKMNRFNILQISTTVNFENDDIETWSINKFVDITLKNYKSSLLLSEEAKNIPIQQWDAILEKDNYNIKLRPTLYDFLAQRFLDFLINDEASINRPFDSFEIKNRLFLGEANTFSNLKISTSDTLSFVFHAVRLFQDITLFHLNDKNPDVLIDIELKRLKYVLSKSSIQDKENHYLIALEQLEKKYINFPFCTNITFELASFFNNNVLSELNTNYIKALNYCNNAIQRFPESEGAAKCQNMVYNIKQPSLSVKIENFNIPEKPFLSLITYKNLQKVYFRIIPITAQKNRTILKNYDSKKIINEYLKIKPISTFEKNVLNLHDYKQYSTEIILPKISEKGLYILLVSSSPDFNCKDEYVAYQSFWITNISYLSRKNNDGSFSYYVLDRETGNPITNATVSSYLNIYDYKARSYQSKEWKVFTTDQRGYFEVPKLQKNDNSYNQFYLIFKKNEDVIVSDEYFYQNYHYIEPERKIVTTHFFTDRAIYRPGQYVFFKGILIEKGSKEIAILPNKKTTVTFYDVNGLKIADLNLVSNEYGSINGNFQIPFNLLNGQMRISNEWGYSYISVEDYKRPKFEVKIEKPEGNYKLNEEVIIKGNAKAFSGSNIDGANVKYTVQRKTYFPYREWWWRNVLPSSNNIEITNGETKTNQDGDFTFNFFAKADDKIDKKYNPCFDFMINVEVTDINGETRSDEQIITVAYHSLNVDVEINDKVDIRNLKAIPVNVRNLSGLPQNTKLKVEIFRLKSPSKAYVERLWQKPNIQSIGEDEFIEKFPMFEYNDENDITKWEFVNKQISTILNYPNDSVIKINNISEWSQGSYLIELTTNDSNGELIKYKKYFTLFSSEEKSVPDNSIFWLTFLNTKAEPGEKASFLIGSSIKNLRVLYEIEVKDEIKKIEWININEEKKLIEIPIIEDYRGNIFVHLTMVKNNRVFKHKQSIIVPFSNKKLDVTFQSFRNKLLPGQKEEWILKIKGSKGENVASEMLATLYDASLDAFKQNQWYFNIFGENFSRLNWSAHQNFDLSNGSICFFPTFKPNFIRENNYPKLNWFGFSPYRYMYGIRGQRSGGFVTMADETLSLASPAKLKSIEDDRLNEERKEELEVYKESDVEEFNTQSNSTKRAINSKDIQIRSNFNETAFFYPQLRTNEKGEMVIAFKIPESLTRWKMMGLAHSKQLEYGFIFNELVTQKELMVVPNTPRFFREGDTLFFSTKVTNLTNNFLTCNINLNFYDAVSMSPINGIIQESAIKIINIASNQNSSVSWKIIIPQGYQALAYRVEASSGIHSDGEEMVIPVLSNRMLVTESLPIWVKANETKNFTFNKLKQSSNSNTLKHYSLTLEFTSNPVWYAIQALPYLMEYPYECNEQIFSRYYANSIASFVANSNPKIRSVFDSWKNSSVESFLSNLEKNQDLKSILIEETPWLMEAKSETERKKMIGLLFDLNKMLSELESAKLKLVKSQLPNGGWSWFLGGIDDHYITQYIVCGFGHLKQLNVLNFNIDADLNNTIKNALKYIDRRVKETYDNLKKWNSKDMDKNQLSPIIVHYIYTRSFFNNDIDVPSSCQEAYSYYFNQVKKYWVSQSIYQQAMISLALYRAKIPKIPSEIIASLKDRAIFSEEMGMYWSDIKSGYYWYQNPVETMSLLIEAFDVVANDFTSVEQMKIWLLKNKQTNDWKTTKATANAIYAIMIRGFDLLSNDKLAQIKVGGKIVELNIAENKTEAGSGYFQFKWNKNEITKNLAEVEVKNPNNNIAWGSLYWQYFEQLDKITTSKTPLSLNKKLFIQRKTASGTVIEPLNDAVSLKVGDKITVRIELRVDRDMEYVHLKDMRAAAFEPVNTISSYKWKNGLGYYESTKDAATNFFISFMPKGTYVFEYELVVAQKGNFANGISTIQCMYAPEFVSHSEGIRVRIKE